MYDAIVLAGGAARRLGGVDKPQLEVGGSTLLDRVLTAAGDAERVVVAGPERPVSAEVRTMPAEVIWCREDPPGGGPVAAIAAALPHTAAPVVLVLAADLPWIAPAVALLVGAVADTDADAALLADAAGRVNYLAAAWRRTSLLTALSSVSPPSGTAMRALVAAAPTQIRVADLAGWGRDCDTWDDLAAARARGGNT